LVGKTEAPLGELQLVLEDTVLTGTSLDAYGHLRGSSTPSPSSDALRFCWTILNGNFYYLLETDSQNLINYTF
jgi:hypothetical protein